jgi:hypothetical protein
MLRRYNIASKFIGKVNIVLSGPYTVNTCVLKPELSSSLHGLSKNLDVSN